MKKAVSFKSLSKLVEKNHSQKKKVVLIGGVFDLIHVGHIRFLKQAKQLGDTLIVLLENDTRVQQKKGVTRPIHTQAERAEMLMALSFVDYIILLPHMPDDDAYVSLTKKISPAIIASTTGDPYEKQKKKQAKMVAAQFIEIPKIQTPSTTQLAKLLKLET